MMSWPCIVLVECTFNTYMYTQRSCIGPPWCIPGEIVRKQSWQGANFPLFTWDQASRSMVNSYHSNVSTENDITSSEKIDSVTSSAKLNSVSTENEITSSEKIDNVGNLSTVSTENDITTEKVSAENTPKDTVSSMEQDNISVTAPVSTENDNITKNVPVENNTKKRNYPQEL